MYKFTRSRGYLGTSSQEFLARQKAFSILTSHRNPLRLLMSQPSRGLPGCASGVTWILRAFMHWRCRPCLRTLPGATDFWRRCIQVPIILALPTTLQYHLYRQPEHAYSWRLRRYQSSPNSPAKPPNFSQSTSLLLW